MRELWELPAGLDPQPPGLDEDARASVREANAVLDRELAALAERVPPAGALLLTGHAHLDLAWRWPLEETRRKARRTLWTAVGLLDRHEHMHFNQSTAQLFAYLEEDDPELLARIEQHAAAGRFEPIGGMWVEPDCVMPCGESLVRQLLYGQRYFQRRFGAYHTVAWLPDCFGFTPALPQLLAGAGIRRFFTIKLTWSETTRFPHDLFWWEGLDGTRVLAHMFDNPEGGYNGVLGPTAALRDVERVPGQGRPPGEPAVGRLRRRRRRADRGDGRARARAARLPGTARAALRPRGRLLRARGDRRRPADLERRAVPGAAPRHADDAGPHEAAAPARRARPRGGGGRVGARVAGRRLRAGVARAAVARAAAQPVPRHPARLEHPRGLRHRRARAGGGRCRGRRADRRRRSRELAAAGDDAALVVNPDLAARPLQVELPWPLPARSPSRAAACSRARARSPGSRPPSSPPVAPAGSLSVSREHLENDFVRVELAADGSLARVYDKRSWPRRARRARQPAVGVRRQAARVGRLGHRRHVRGPGRGAAARARDRGRRERPAPRRRADRARVPRLAGRAARAPVGRLAPDRLPHAARLARPPLAAQGALPHRRPRPARDVRDRVRRRGTVPAPRHARRGGAVRGPRPPLRRPVGAGIRRRAAQRRPLRAPRARQRAGHQPPALADLARPAGRRGRAGDRLRAPPPRRRRQRARRRPRISTARCSLTRPARPRRPLRPLRIEGRAALGALKPLEDGGGLVLRVYEPFGDRGRVAVDPPPGWALDTELDLLERPAGAPQTELGPFAVRTWALRPTSPPSA